MFSKGMFRALLLVIFGYNHVTCITAIPREGLSFDYAVSTRTVTWREAFILCKQNGMELVSITSTEEHDAIAEFLASYPMKHGTSSGYWTAGIRFATSSNIFAWFTTGKPIVFSKFAPGEPDNARNSEDCVEYFKETGSNKTYLWNDMQCDHKAGYICQYGITSIC